MTREEFIKQRCEIDKITLEKFEEQYRVVECNCGQPYCKGYRCLDLDGLLKENKILKENAENNDKVVDKANWENQLLKKENEQLKNDINKLQKELNEENLQCSKYSIGFNNLKEKNKQLKEQLLVAQTNEETFRLEMEDITKTLGLDEDTIFDDVKACVKNLKDNWNKLKEYCEEVTFYYTTGNGEFKTEMVGNARNGIDILNKMQELEKGSDSNG